VITRSIKWFSLLAEAVADEEEAEAEVLAVFTSLATSL
tara:strand:- start:624 stop:737 length:114 start_codon:yes stop_codon:yes gene_type:complete